MKTSFNKEKYAYVAIIIFSVLILVRDLANISIPFVIFSLLIAVFGVFTDSNGRLIIISYLLPFCRALPYSEMLLITLGIEMLFKIKNLRIHAKLYLPILGVAIIELVDYFRFDIFTNEIVYLLLYMLYTTFVIDQQIGKARESTVARLFSVGSIVAVISVVVREINQLGMSYITVYGVRFGTETNGRMVTNFNSNELGLYCGIAAAFLIIEYLNNKKMMDIIIAIVVSALGFVSVSRTYMVIIILLWLYFAIKQLKSVRGMIITIGLLIAAIFIVTKFFPEFTTWIVEYYAKRNSQASVDGLSGRVGIMKLLFDYYFASVWSVLFGYSEMYPIVLGTSGAHNGLQEMLVSWGAIGFVISAVWIIVLFRKQYSCIGGISKQCLIPFGIFILFIQTLQFFTMHNYLIMMLLTIIYVSSNLNCMHEDKKWIKN